MSCELRHGGCEEPSSLESVSSSLADDQIVRPFSLPLSRDLQNSLQWFQEDILQSLHDLCTRSELDGLPFLDEGVDRPQGVDENGGSRRCSGNGRGRVNVGKTGE